jgi:hypothetical protein
LFGWLCLVLCFCCVNRKNLKPTSGCLFMNRTISQKKTIKFDATVLFC